MERLSYALPRLWRLWEYLVIHVMDQGDPDLNLYHTYTRGHPLHVVNETNLQWLFACLLALAVR